MLSSRISKNHLPKFSLALITAFSVTANAQLPSTGPTATGMAAEIQANNMDVAKDFIKDSTKLTDGDAVIVLKAALGPGVDKELRKLAIETAFKCRAIVADKVLGEAMASEDPLEKVDIIKKVGKLNSSIQISLIGRAFDDRVQRVKEEALKAATKFPNEQKIEILRNASGNSDPLFRVKVVEEAGKLDRTGAYTITEAFRTDKDSRVKAAIAKVWAKHKIEE